jgi:hypothetical protein
MSPIESLAALQQESQPLLQQLYALQVAIHQVLATHADGKLLKGNEVVAWLGEIYGKTFLGGTLVSDSEEHDFICVDGRRVSVKARRGTRSGWRRSSAIPSFTGEACPTHLLFVHLNDDYSLDRMWLFPWLFLVQSNRFEEHMVRGSRRSYVFSLDEKRDAEYVVYPTRG